MRTRRQVWEKSQLKKQRKEERRQAKRARAAATKQGGSHEQNQNA